MDNRLTPANFHLTKELIWFKIGTVHIGLISDTHIPDHAKELPKQLKEAFRGVDLILHAGDIYVTSVLDELEHLAPVLAAQGDDDPLSTINDKRVKGKHILNIDGLTIWLTHERPWFFGDGEKKPDIIVFGHTHHPLEKRDDSLFINPGSATFPHYVLEPGTVGLLTINSGKVETRIIQLQ